MRVLVTGAAGFVAPHVAQRLTVAGHEVLLADISKQVSPVAITAADLTSLEDMHRITQGVDAVCHLGGIGDVYLAAEKPYLAASANVVGTATLLEACRTNGVKKLVYASTWEVYGPPQYQPIDEQHPCNPDHPYNITKLAGERLAMAFDELKGLPTITLRLGTAYGLGMRPNSVFSLFVQRALDGEPITIAGTGGQSRQFTHVSDIAEAFALALEAQIHGEVMNIVAEETISIRTLAEIVISQVPTEIQFGPARAGDVSPAEISSKKAKASLGWSAATEFKTGLLELIDSIKAQHSSVTASLPDGAVS